MIDEWDMEVLDLERQDELRWILVVKAWPPPKKSLIEVGTDIVSIIRRMGVALGMQICKDREEPRQCKMFMDHQAFKHPTKGLHIVYILKATLDRSIVMEKAPYEQMDSNSISTDVEISGPQYLPGAARSREHKKFQGKRKQSKAKRAKSTK